LPSNLKFNSICFRESERSQPTEPLHHYTNQTGLLGIFGSGEFWATKIQYMNDATEFQYALGLAKKALEKHYSDISFSIKNHLAWPTLERRQCDLLQWMTNHLDAISPANICSVSFCTDPDLLSQWRGYTGLGVGYAIGFDPNGLREITQNNACSLGRCIYEKSLQEQIINELIEEALTHAKRCLYQETLNCLLGAFGMRTRANFYARNLICP
jgi:hypothetical protein